MNLRKALRKADKFRRQAQNVATLGGSEMVGRRLGGRLDARTLIGRVAGGRNLKALGFRGPSPKTVTAAEKNTGFPGTANGGESGCVQIDPADGSVRKPYALIGRFQLAASAQAVATALGDFLLAAAVDDITTDNVIPFGVTIERAQMFIGLNELIASPVLNPAIALSSYVKFSINGIEEARWPVAKFNPVISNNGLVTSGGGATMFSAEFKPVPFRVYFDPDKTYKLELFITKAITPAAVSDWTLVMDGFR